MLLYEPITGGAYELSTNQVVVDDLPIVAVPSDEVGEMSIGDVAMDEVASGDVAIDGSVA